MRAESTGVRTVEIGRVDGGLNNNLQALNKSAATKLTPAENASCKKFLREILLEGCLNINDFWDCFGAFSSPGIVLNAIKGSDNEEVFLVTAILPESSYSAYEYFGRVD